MRLHDLEVGARNASREGSLFLFFIRAGSGQALGRLRASPGQAPEAHSRSTLVAFSFHCRFNLAPASLHHPFASPGWLRVHTLVRFLFRRLRASSGNKFSFHSRFILVSISFQRRCIILSQALGKLRAGSGQAPGRLAAGSGTTFSFHSCFFLHSQAPGKLREQILVPFSF